MIDKNGIDTEDAWVCDCCGGAGSGHQLIVEHNLAFCPLCGSAGFLRPFDRRDRLLRRLLKKSKEELFG